MESPEFLQLSGEMNGGRHPSPWQPRKLSASSDGGFGWPLRDLASVSCALFREQHHHLRNGYWTSPRKWHCHKLFLKFCITLPWILLFLPRRNFPLPKNSYFFYFQLVFKVPEMAIDSNLYVHRLAKWQLGALHIILTWITCQSKWSHFLH